jgi:hypothetical protein
MAERIFVVKCPVEKKNDEYSSNTNILFHTNGLKKEGKTRFVNTEPQNGMGRCHLAVDP